jgi:hypothetical protein
MTVNQPSTHGGAPSFETCGIQHCRENAAALAAPRTTEGETV